MFWGTGVTVHNFLGVRQFCIATIRCGSALTHSLISWLINPILSWKKWHFLAFILKLAEFCMCCQNVFENTTRSSTWQAVYVPVSVPTTCCILLINLDNKFSNPHSVRLSLKQKRGTLDCFCDGICRKKINTNLWRSTPHDISVAIPAMAGPQLGPGLLWHLSYTSMQNWLHSFCVYYSQWTGNWRIRTSNMFLIVCCMCSWTSAGTENGIDLDCLMNGAYSLSLNS
jgi:hypothetical protein